MYNKQCIGTCSNCGGQVTVPTIYWSVIPPVPTCESCGATARPHGPVIDMNPSPVRKTWTSAWTGECDMLDKKIKLEAPETRTENIFGEFVDWDEMFRP